MDSIEYVGVIDLNDPAPVNKLNAYVSGSSFSSIEEWMRAYKVLSSDRSPAYPYHIKLAYIKTSPLGITQGA